MNQNELSLIAISLVTSFIGSWHCALMCGPIAANFRSNQGLSAYQMGRMLSYICIGAICGQLGSFLLSPSLSKFRIALGILFGVVLILAALQQLSSRSSGASSSSLISKIYLSVLKFLKSQGLFRFPFLAGMLTALLPCAWLFTWALAAAHSHSVFIGALLMFILWLGSVPALSAISIFIKRGHQLSSNRQRKILFFVLLLSGLYAVGSQLVFGLGLFQIY